MSQTEKVEEFESVVYTLWLLAEPLSSLAPGYEQNPDTRYQPGLGVGGSSPDTAQCRFALAWSRK